MLATHGYMAYKLINTTILLNKSKNIYCRKLQSPDVADVDLTFEIAEKTVLYLNFFVVLMALPLIDVPWSKAIRKFCRRIGFNFNAVTILASSSCHAAY